jgi:hypothetical protein
LARIAVERLITTGGIMWSVPATAVLVELLLGRGSDRDLADADTAFERVADVSAEPGLALHDLWLLRMRPQLKPAPAATHTGICASVTCGWPRILISKGT